MNRKAWVYVDLSIFSGRVLATTSTCDCIVLIDIVVTVTLPMVQDIFIL